MVWVAGIFGFIAGFCAGLLLLRKWLAGRSREELITDKNLHWSYGVFVWLIAFATAAATVWLYKYYITSGML